MDGIRSHRSILLLEAAIIAQHRSVLSGVPDSCLPESHHNPLAHCISLDLAFLL